MKGIVSMAKNLECQHKIFDLVEERMEKLGKKDNATFSEVYNDIIIEHPEWFAFVGVAERDDVHLAMGNLREDGLRIAEADKMFRPKEGENEQKS